MRPSDGSEGAVRVRRVLEDGGLAGSQHPRELLQPKPGGTSGAEAAHRGGPALVSPRPLTAAMDPS